jgi:hypothetical protein
MGHRPASELPAESGNQSAGKNVHGQGTRQKANRRESFLIDTGKKRLAGM